MGDITKKVTISKDFLPTLSVCMIVKNEENNLKRLLPLLDGIVDELIIVDTGSSDGTKDIALQYTSNFHYFEWCDDFSAARNESLKYATKDYILWLDADDIISKQDIARLKLHIKKYPNTGVFVTLVDKRPTKEFQSIQLRAFPNIDGIKFVGKVHEQVSFSIEQVGLKYSHCAIVITHLGYDSEEAVIKKLERNIRILEKELSENSNDFLYNLHLAKTYLGVGHVDKAVPYSKKALELVKDVEISKENAFMAYMTECTILSLQGKTNEAVFLMEKAKELFPDNKILQLTLAEMYFRRKDYKKAYKELLFIKTSTLGIGLIPIDAKDMSKAMMQLLITSALHIGDFETAEFCLGKIYNDPDYTIYRG